MYTAPELIGSDYYTSKVDVCSFGVMIAGVQALPLANGKLARLLEIGCVSGAAESLRVSFSVHGGRFEKTRAIDDT